MPTYEYKCDACGHAFEKFQQMSAAPIKKCPKCGKSKVRRLIGTGAGLIFKGSGFYITDYRDKSYADSAKADSSSPSSDAKSETKSDAKPDAKADAKPAENKSAENKPAETKAAAEAKPAVPKSEPKASKSASKSGKKK